MIKEYYNILIEIQALNKKIQNHQNSITDHTKRGDFVAQQIQVKKNQSESLTIQNIQIQEKIHLLEQNLDKICQQIENSKTIDSNVKSYERIEQNLQSLKNQESKIEDDLLELIDQQEQKQLEITEIQQFLMGSTKTLNDIEKEIQEDILNENKQINSYQQRVDSLLEQLPHNWVTKYNHLQKKLKHIELISFIKNNLCSKCHLRIAPQEQNELEISNDLTLCSMCSRILIPITMKI